MTYDFDLLVIGAGSGGVRASRMAAGTGAKVAVVESGRLGGTCVNLGCVPKKLLSYGAHFSEDFVDARSYGWDVGTPKFDWRTLIENKDREIERLNGIYQRILENAGVRIIRGRARLLDPHTVEVDGERFSADKILIGVGSLPVIPESRGADLGVPSDAMFHLPEQPKRMIAVGGGYISIEFASIMQSLGTEVTLVHRREKVLRGFDEDVRTVVTEHLRGRGIDLRLDQEVMELERRGDGLRATLSSGETVDTDLLLCAIGRRPNTDNLGLENAGVKTDESGAIVVDDHYRTSTENIFALGDVIDRVTLTPVALAEAMVFVDTVFRDRPRTLSYEDIPSAVFTHPPVAVVGLSEADARAKYGTVDIYRSSFRPLRDTLTPRDEKTLMKMVVNPASDRVVGVHVVGTDAPEIVQGFAVALQCGATKAQLDATVGIHPTSAEELVTMRTKA